MYLIHENKFLPFFSDLFTPAQIIIADFEDLYLSEREVEVTNTPKSSLTSIDWLKNDPDDYLSS